MATMFVKPADRKDGEGNQIKVLHRERSCGATVYLKEDGENVPVNNYWLERLRNGDVIKIDAVNSGGAGNEPDEFESLTKNQLAEKYKDLGIDFSKMNKSTMIDAIKTKLAEKTEEV